MYGYNQLFLGITHHIILSEGMETDPGFPVFVLCDGKRITLLVAVQGTLYKVLSSVILAFVDDIEAENKNISLI